MQELVKDVTLFSDYCVMFYSPSQDGHEKHGVLVTAELSSRFNSLLDPFLLWQTPWRNLSRMWPCFLTTVLRLILQRMAIRMSQLITLSAFHSLKPHCIQSSWVLVPAGTSKSTLRRHSIQAVTMAYVADAVTLWHCLQQCVLAALN
jgi:hypothetical protein